MAQFKIENKKLSIEIFGVVYEIRKPKFKDIIDIEEKTDALTPKEKVHFIHEKLVSYGIPDEVLNELDSDAYIELL